MSCQPEIHLSVLLGCACEDKGVFRHWVLDFENLGYRAGTSRHQWHSDNRPHHLRCISNYEPGVQTFYITFAPISSADHLGSSAAWNGVTQLSFSWWSGHVSRIWWIVARRFKDKLEDETSVRLSPGGGSHQDLDWRWYRGDNNYTNINQGEDYDGIHFGQFSVGSNQNHVPALDNLTQWYFCWWL